MAGGLSSGMGVPIARGMVGGMGGGMGVGLGGGMSAFGSHKKGMAERVASRNMAMR